MYGSVGGRPGYLSHLFVAALCLVAAGCGEDGAPEASLESAVDAGATVAAEQEPEAEPALRPFLPDDMQRSTRAESFPHPAHQDISCAVCHQTPQGHASHGELSCADCHRASQNARLATLAPEDCQSCHHAADQSRSCETCHESRGTLVSEQQLFLEVWSTPRTRALSFDHDRHSDLTCGSCHRALPALTPAESCASCHADHHTTEVRCVSCHVTDAIDSHDVQAHVTCSGSGCHRARDVEAISTSRNVCLACHVEQESHEPGGNCIECHRVRPEPVAWADWRHR